MRTLFKLLVFITITLFFFSCTKQDFHEPVTTATQSELVSIDEARQVARGFAQKKFPKNQSKNSLPTIAEEETIKENNLPYFYVFNMADKGGFVIVSAEKYAHPILAFGEEGEFQTEGAPYGIISWIGTTKQNIDYIRNGKINTRLQSIAEWNIVAKDYDVPSLKIMPPEPGCQETSVSTTKGPLIATNWGQGCGYNDFVPIDPSGASCGRYPTGCVATAMAQIMRYWQFPTTWYNWSSMANNWGTSETARLMDDIGGAVGMSYATNGSGASHGNIAPALINTFGYSSAQNIGYGLSSYSTVQSQLSANRPVLLCGYHDKNTSWFGLVVEYSTGHEWVCDGYIDTDITWCNPDGSSGGAGYLSFHMNWGWNGTANGWYGFDSWAPYGQGYNFQYSRKAVINIHP